MSTNRTKPVTYRLRLSKELDAWLRANAKKNYRTLAGEINMHLEKAREASEQDESTAAANENQLSLID